MIEYDEALPTGIELRHALERHTTDVNCLAWSPDGKLLASGDEVGRIAVWNPSSGHVDELHGPVEEDGSPPVRSLAWHSDGVWLFGGGDAWGRTWDTSTWREVPGTPAWAGTLSWSAAKQELAVAGWGSVGIWPADHDVEPEQFEVDAVSPFTIAHSPDGAHLAWGGRKGTLVLLERASGNRWSLSGHGGDVNALAWSPDGDAFVTASDDETLLVWHRSGRPLTTLEGHTSSVLGVGFSACGRLMASKGHDGVRLWRTDTWEQVAAFYEQTTWPAGLAFHPSQPLLATADGGDKIVRIWALDVERLLGEPALIPSVQHVTAKVVLVGDSGVGKTGLGWRLAHGEFKEHSSTHGQQFWVLESLRTKRSDGTECEPVLWDLAGQPDYRLIHALFLDDAELALVVFDPTDRFEPLHGVEYWLRALGVESGGRCRAILVGARVDRGHATLTEDEIVAFCQERGILGGYLATSAMAGIGLDELTARMSEQLAWEQAVATVTTTTFSRIKEFVLGLKEGDDVVVETDALRSALHDLDPSWEFSDNELLTAVGHLAKHGYVQVLRTAAGGRRILLRPDLLNGLASSIVLEARRNVKGLGSLDETSLRAGDYPLGELVGLSDEDREVLVDAAIVLFVEHNICFRESVGTQSLLVFPELINRKKPATEGTPTVDDVSYTVSGQVANVYAALVVLLGYTNMFVRTDQWKSQAQYEFASNETCGFRQVAERDGELDFVLYYGRGVSESTRLIFQGLFERILLGRKVKIARYPALNCPKCGYRQDRSEVVRRTEGGLDSLFCSNCGAQVTIPSAEALHTGTVEERAVAIAEATAGLRTTFEAALAHVSAYVRTRDARPRRCFVSYAWGTAAHEQWVEDQLSKDLRNAGIDVILDRWANAAIGGSVARFLSLIGESENIVLVGTPLYHEKYENKRSDTGTKVAAEVDLINLRLTGTEVEKATVLPVLLDGEEATSFPPLARGRVFADFRDESRYLPSLFDLILTIYGVPFDDDAVADLRDSLRSQSARKA